MTYYIYDGDGVPIVADNLRQVEGWILGTLKAKRDITITRPGPQPWRRSTWRHNRDENHKHSMPNVQVP